MKAKLLIAGFLVSAGLLKAQQNQILTNIPNLEITDVELRDENGNQTVESNESCQLIFQLRNSGGKRADGVKVSLRLLEPASLDINYRKSRSIGTVAEKTGQRVKIPIAGGKNLNEAIAKFRIEITEVNGFNSAPMELEVNTATGNLKTPQSNALAQSDFTDPDEDTTRLKIVGLHYNDHNGNQHLEAFETSSIDFRLYNMRNEPIHGISLKLAQVEGNSEGVYYDRTTDLGSLQPNEWRDVSLEIKGRKDIADGSMLLQLFLLEDFRYASNHNSFVVDTRAYTKPALRFSHAEFMSLDGSNLKKEVPIQLKLLIENTGSGSAFDLDVAPRPTAENIKIEGPKSGLNIEEIPGGESREIIFNLIAGSDYMFPNLPLIIEVTENFNGLFLDTVVIASLDLVEPGMEHAPELAQNQENPQNKENLEEPLEEDLPETRIMAQSPPDLEVLNLEFKDEDQNNTINYTESCEIKFIIRNSGMGTASNISVQTDQRNTDITGLRFQDRITLGDLGPGQEVPVSIPIRSTGIQRNDKAEFIIHVLEEGGWDANPQSLLVETQKLLEPDLDIRSANFHSASGFLKPNEVIEFRIALENKGAGDAEEINVLFELPNSENCFLYGEGIDEFNLDRLKSGEVKEFSISMITNRRYTEPEIPISLTVSESYRNYGIDTVINGKMNEEALAISTHVVSPVVSEPPAERTSQQQTQPSQRTDQEPAVQTQDGTIQQPPPSQDETTSEYTGMRGGGDPLKNLGYEEAVEDLRIGRYFALIIGIDDYQGIWPPLRNAVSDAKAVEELLRSKYRFDHFETLYDDMATGSNILAKLTYLIENVTEEDNLLIFYSGHGDFNETLNRGYWVPIDATSNDRMKYLSNSEIQDYLQAIKSKHTLLISDACFSGDIFRGETLTIPLVRSERYYRQQYSKPSRRAITSGGIEPVLDSGMEGHSVFTYYLLNILESNGEQFFDASELFTQLKVPVFNNSEQSPIFLPIKDAGDQGGQFIFIHK